MSDQERDTQNKQEDTKDTEQQSGNYSGDQRGKEDRGYNPRRSSNYSSSSRNDDSRDSDDSGRRSRPYRKNKPFFRKKIDKIKAQNLTIDYKHPEVLQRFVTNRGKILPRRITGTSAKNQRKLVREIKKARIMAFLPFG